MQSFAKAPITCRTGLRVARIEPGKGVYATNAEGGEEFIPADGIVYAMGMRPNTGIVDELKDVCIDTIAVATASSPARPARPWKRATGLRSTWPEPARNGWCLVPRRPKGRTFDRKKYRPAQHMLRRLSAQTAEASSSAVCFSPFRRPCATEAS